MASGEFREPPVCAGPSRRTRARLHGQDYAARYTPIVSGHDGGPEDEVVVDIPVGLEPMLVETARQRRAREGREDG